MDIHQIKVANLSTVLIQNVYIVHYVVLYAANPDQEMLHETLLHGTAFRSNREWILRGCRALCDLRQEADKFNLNLKRAIREGAQAA